MFRLGLICDFSEERWASMDLVGNVLLEEFRRRHEAVIEANLIRPSLRRRASALPIGGSCQAAWNADRLWNRLYEYPRWLQRQMNQHEIYHIVDHSYAHLALGLRAGRTVVTCHDLETFRCLAEPAKEPRPLWFRLMAKRILAGLRSAAHVIFVSEAVRQQATELRLLPNVNTSVIHNGADFGDETDSLAGGDIRASLGIEDEIPILLSVGTTVARKRIDILLRVFADVKRKFPAVRLVRVGGPLTLMQQRLAQQLNVSEFIIQVPFVSRPVLRSIYRRATLLLQTSEREGFALPVAEAMACGCPVVASDLPVLREVGGDAARYCAEGDIAGWSASVISLLNRERNEPVAWQAMQRRSIENARRFRWRENADQVLNVYRAVLAGDFCR